MAKRSAAEKAVESITVAIDEAVESLPRSQYLEVLETLISDLETRATLTKGDLERLGE